MFPDEQISCIIPLSSRKRMKQMLQIFQLKALWQRSPFFQGQTYFGVGPSFQPARVVLGKFPKFSPPPIAPYSLSRSLSQTHFNFSFSPTIAILSFLLPPLAPIIFSLSPPTFSPLPLLLSHFLLACRAGTQQVINKTGIHLDINLANSFEESVMAVPHMTLPLKVPHLLAAQQPAETERAVWDVEGCQPGRVALGPLSDHLLTKPTSIPAHLLKARN